MAAEHFMALIRLIIGLPRPETQQNLWTKFYNTRICSLSGCSTSASSHGNKTCKPLKQQQQQQNEIKTLV
uniref:Uncharacterized protein n=1 Tax=Oryza rufipogon TaxID=4529 RepID=A0A0E0RE26_ORYRU